MRHTLLITARTYCNGKPPPWQHRHRRRPGKPSKMTALSTPNGDEAATAAALTPLCARRSRFRGFMICLAWFWWECRYLMRKEFYHKPMQMNHLKRDISFRLVCNTWWPGDLWMWTTMMTSSNGNIKAPHYWPFVREIRWIPRTKASDAALWCFLWSAWINGWANNRLHRCIRYK